MLVVLYVNVLWYLYDVTPTLGRFRQYPGPGVWQIGIRAIDYSELVNFLKRKEIQKFTTIVTNGWEQTLNKE